jgi:signal transduction histidine kinase
MTNALRHADARRIDISIDVADGRLRMCVRDDGRGLPDRRRPGASGLFAMESRAETIGGRIELSSGDDGDGTTVLLEVPLDQPGGTT